MAEWRQSLARQRKLQVTRYFTTQMLHYHNLRLDSEDYKVEQVRAFNLPSLFLVLRRFLELQSAGILGSGFYFPRFLMRKRQSHSPSPTLS